MLPDYNNAFINMGSIKYADFFKFWITWALRLKSMFVFKYLRNCT